MAAHDAAAYRLIAERSVGGKKQLLLLQQEDDSLPDMGTNLVHALGAVLPYETHSKDLFSVSWIEEGASLSVRPTVLPAPVFRADSKNTLPQAQRDALVAWMKQFTNAHVTVAGRENFIVIWHVIDLKNQQSVQEALRIVDTFPMSIFGNSSEAP